jgi:hypothetical protein
MIGLGMSMVKKIVETLDGKISVDSEVNQGTKVTVQFPLTPTYTNTEPTHGSPSGQSKMSSNPVSLLHVECPDKTVAFYGFDTASTILLKDSVQFYLTEWYHFRIIQSIHLADFVVVDETSLDNLFSKFTGNALPSRIVALRSTTIRDKNMPAAIHSILKPVGPYGLAKVLLNCWTRTSPRTGGLVVATSQEHAAHAVQENPAPKDLITDEFKDVLELVPVQADSKAISGTATTQDITPKDVMVEKTSVSIHEQVPETQLSASPEPKSLEIRGAACKKEPEACVVETKQPQILCVDDNPINLKILQAYLKKLEKKNVRCVENGLEAFKAVETSDTPFDVIFMGNCTSLQFF